jgi:cytochrome P450
MTHPPHPVAAVTHPDPYPYYAELVARRPLYRDEALGLWVASSAETVTAVLTSELCRVRPPAEPVPGALLGSPAAVIFGRLVRMNDGPWHDAVKPALAQSLDALAHERVAEESERWARALAADLDLATFPFRLSSHVVGALLGVPAPALPEVARWTGELVEAFAPTGSVPRIEHGKAAAARLLDLFRSLLATRRDGLLLALGGRGGHAGQDEGTAIVANGIGLLTQAYEATAGLIGNTLLVLAALPAVRTLVAADAGILPDVVEEVLRFDPPVQNTRRFLARGGAVAGQAMNEGEAILVVLAAANRDPAANPDPARFDVARKDRRSFTFGVGPHACPGQALATAIATAGVASLLRAGVEPRRAAAGACYRPSLNGRIPLFATR